MALSASSMKDKIKARLTALGVTDTDFGETADGSVTMEQILEAFCQGVIDEITTNAVVNQPNDGGGDAEAPGTIV